MSISAYTSAVGKEKEPDDTKIESPAALRMSIQQQSNWIRNAQTQEVFKQIGEEINKLETEARTLACQFASHQNAHGIVHRLVRSSELRNFVEKYGKVNT